jgi:hypothetical protein
VLDLSVVSDVMLAKGLTALILSPCCLFKPHCGSVEP